MIKQQLEKVSIVDKEGNNKRVIMELLKNGR